MNKVFMVWCVLTLTGCSAPVEWATAAKNYAKDNCKGALLEITTLDVQVSLESNFFYKCVEEAGVKSYNFSYKDVPVKYWEIAND